MSAHSINSYITGIRALIYYLIRKGYISAFEIKKIKADRKVKDIYTDDELERLMKKPVIDKCGFSEYRNWVMICYLMGTGNRLRTICNIKIKHIDFQHNEILLEKTKNRRSYTIPMTSFLAEILAEYLTYRGGNSEDYLFCNQYGEYFTDEGIKSAIERYNKRHGVSKSSIHLFRHTFATLYMRKPNADIYQLKEMLEHSSVQQTEQYISQLPGVRVRRIESVNPLEDLKSFAKSRQGIKMR